MAALDNNTEIDEEINVEEIMRKIRENVRKKKEAGIFPVKEVVELKQNSLPKVPTNENNTQRDLAYISSNWEIQNNTYHISSHRPVVGTFLVKGREMVHGEVKRYVDPTIWKQQEFNASTVRLFTDASVKLNYCNNKIEQLQSEMNFKIEQLRPELEDQVAKLKPEFDNCVKRLKSEFENNIEHLSSKIDIGIKAEVNSAVSSMNSNIENKAWLASILDEKLKERLNDIKTETPDSTGLEINYFRFEEQFRGSREEIKQRQSNFINYFLGCSNVLDIGCGRGEFLELAKENGIDAKGVDIDDTMVDYCLSKGLNVVKEDAISYLEKLDDKSLDGIFIDQVVEHMEPDILIKLLNLCFKKLKYGFYIFAETVNPLSLVSFANFYIDMTHKKPVHPETLKFLLASVGFRDLDVKFFSPVSEEAKLKKLPLSENSDECTKKYLEIYNQNVEKLNNILYGAQDYAVIGKK